MVAKPYAVAFASVVDALEQSFKAADRRDHPFQHWLIGTAIPRGVPPLTERMRTDLANLPGLPNQARLYATPEVCEAYPVLDTLAKALQIPATTTLLAERFEAELAGTFLRLEYAHDTDGFWRAPEAGATSVRLRLVIYLSGDAGLGDDLYDQGRRFVARVPFAPNCGMLFLPSPLSLHGFEKRRIVGIRKSVTVDYVTAEFAARDQLAFPGLPVVA